MTQKQQIYKCAVCGNTIEVIHRGTGKLICCDKHMTVFRENVQDKGQESHLPVVKRKGDLFEVKVGRVPHPMQQDHYIQWIEVHDGNRVYREYLDPDTPDDKDNKDNKDKKPVEARATFRVQNKHQFAVRIYCNLHGLWKTFEGIQL